MLTALIMAGGSGQRFWPLSRENKPKQLLSLVTEKTMIKETVDRILPLIPADKIFVATNMKYAEDIAQELTNIPKANIIVEPVGRDTAACIGYSALVIEKKFPGAVMAVLASDHIISKEKEFMTILDKAYKEADGTTKIVTLGIKPDKPETGYGYIEAPKDEIAFGKAIMKVKAFHEKPNLEKAEFFMEEGNYLWNSGMFILSISTALNSIKTHMKSHTEVLSKIKGKLDLTDKTGTELANLIKDEFGSFEKISIDYGVMEKHDEIEVIPADIGWNDIGSFPALEDVFEKSNFGSVIKRTKAIEIDSNNNIIIGTGKKMISTVGIKDTIIVETEDAILICAKDDAQHIKKVVQKIKEIGEETYL